MKLRKPLLVFTTVVYALFLRELDMRFSSGRSGLFWTFVEPFVQILLFVLIKVVLFGSSDSAFNYAVFLALNFTAFNMFKNIVTKSQNAFSANKALFVYKQIKPIDTIIARTLVEIFITAIIVCVFIIIGLYLGLPIEPKNLNMVASAFLFLILFSFSFALLVSVANSFFQSIGKLIGFFMTGLMFGSAVFYALEILPVHTAKLLLYNPLTHFMEMLHGFYFVALDDRFVDYEYIWLWTIVLLYTGLWLYSKLEKRIVSI